MTRWATGRIKARGAAADTIDVLHRTTSRWESSAVTFGPIGRVAVTMLLFVPVWFGIHYNMFFLVGAAIWLFVLPMALHQIWQPAEVDQDTAWPLLRPSSTEPLLRPSSTEPLLRPSSTEPLLRPYPSEPSAPETATLAAVTR